MIYVFLAEGFEMIEALTPVDVLRRANLEVTLVGVGEKTVCSSHGVPVVCDCTDSEVAPGENVQAVILPGGGNGTINLEKSSKVHDFIDYTVQNNILLCAICAAPSILGHKNILNGKRAICFPGFEKDLYGALVCDAPVVRDGNIITAKGMGVSLQFGLEIAAEFVGREQADQIKKSVQSV